jgi:hypothetical protein
MADVAARLYSHATESGMKVGIKEFNVAMEVKNNGIEFEVYDNDGTFRGDCYLTKTGLIWCEGKTSRAKGKKISWDEFIEKMNARK